MFGYRINWPYVRLMAWLAMVNIIPIFIVLVTLGSRF